MELVAGGLSVNAAAKALGANRAVVRKACDDAGVAIRPRPGYSPEVRRRAVELVAGGLSTIKAGRIVGVSYETVRLWCHAEDVNVGYGRR